ncbi:peptidase inhibitor family I36 protein [Streptomyces beigongshangae]|uniref:peptidase inhibitor family I36 protein n=1 Tax=Streptomyces beigongshangae TaxID=2841597 RepID=UPI001C843208|nr:peptidase inhibitor family I36 protein [Streptomyces sp. REN17]
MRRVWAVAAGVVLTMGGTAGTSAATPASGPDGTSAATMPTSVKTAAAPAGCNSGSLCFWNGQNYTGAGPGQLSGKNPDWSVFGNSACPNGNWDNCASSIYNNGVNCNSVTWTNKNYGGGFYSLPRGTGETQLASSHNNAFSSNSWISPSNTTTSTCSGPNPYD